MLSALDQSRLQEALDLATHAIGLSEPNPRVGCVIGHEDGRVLGTGFTQQVGGPHAEVQAMREARRAGHDLAGATAWVTLEPCAHHGRTPPCCDALIAAGIGRVVVAIDDPFPGVAGQGIARMRAAGLRVDVAEGPLRDAAREMNIGFFSRLLRGRPWVRLKIAASLDGLTALPDGSSQWITGEAARMDGHVWRRRAAMVLTGIGTVLADDPQLSVRAVSTARQPLRAVLDSRLRTPATARCLEGGGTVLFACSDALPAATPLRDQGAEIVVLPPSTGGLDLVSLLTELDRRQVNELHVEAGATLTGAWLQSGLVDEVIAYVAPVLLGRGAPLANLPPPASLAGARRFETIGVLQLGQDIRLRLRPAGAVSTDW